MTLRMHGMTPRQLFNTLRTMGIIVFENNSFRINEAGYRINDTAGAIFLRGLLNAFTNSIKLLEAGQIMGLPDGNEISQRLADQIGVRLGKKAGDEFSSQVGIIPVLCAQDENYALAKVALGESVKKIILVAFCDLRENDESDERIVVESVFERGFDFTLYEADRQAAQTLIAQTT